MDLRKGRKIFQRGKHLVWIFDVCSVSNLNFNHFLGSLDPKEKNEDKQAG
jgi:hypothetical protein